MKKLSKIVISFLMLIALASVVAIQGYAAPSKYFDAQYYTQNIPTGYYNNVDTTKTGADFRRDLSTIISAGYVKHSYSANNEVLTYTDPDPSGNGKIICLYTGQSLSSGSWNKEHVWAKSHGFPSESAYPYCDAHHLRPTQNNINSSRGNSDFGEVSNGSSDSFGNRWTSSTFEPRDEVKGDVARMMFYMATRYGFDGTYNLTLVNDSQTSGSTGNGKFGNLQTLLKWHYQDPVSKEEIYRNNIIYQFYQKNRNPYIDHPEYVDLAYPNSYSSSQTVDETKVNNVINLIGSLPATITLDHKAQVTAAKTAYDALNSLEKAEIVNYAELTRALSAISALENGGGTTPVNPDVPTTQGDIEIDFSKASGLGGAYTPGVTVTASSKTFYASYAGYWSDENGLRLGYNDKATGNKVLDSKLGISGNGAYLEPQFDVENLKSMSVSITNKWGSDMVWYVLFKASGSNTYKQVATGTPGSATSFTISASLSTPANGRFVIVLAGTSPRTVISTMSLYTEVGGGTVPDIPDDDAFIDVFITEQTSSSIKLEYNKETGEVLDADLRFGARISAASYNSNAKYGVIVVEGEFAEFLEAGIQDNPTAEDFYGEPGYNLEITPVRVNAAGEADSNGEYYQFAWVITNMEGHYDVELAAVIYIEYEGVLFFGNAVTTSLSACAKTYVNSQMFTDSVLISALQSLYE